MTDTEKRDQEIESLGAALAAGDEDYVTALEYGWCLLDRGTQRHDVSDLEEAVHWLRACAVVAHEVDPDPWLVWVALADAHEELWQLTEDGDRLDQLIACLARGLDLGIDHPDQVIDACRRLLHWTRTRAGDDGPPPPTHPVNEWYERAHEAVWHEEADPEYASLVGGYLVGFGFWLYPGQVLHWSGPEREHRFARDRRLLDRAATLADPPEGWTSLIAVFAETLTNVERGFGGSGDWDSTAVLEALQDPELAEAQTEVTEQLALASSMRAIDNGDLALAAAGAELLPDSPHGRAMGVLLRLTHLITAGTAAAELARFGAEVETAYQELADTEDPDAVWLLALLDPLRSILLPGKAGQSGMDSPDLGVLNSYAAAAPLMTKLETATRTEDVALLREVCQGLDELMANGEELDHVTGLLTMVRSLAHIELARREPWRRDSLDIGIAGYDQLLPTMIEERDPHIPLHATTLAEGLRLRAGPGDLARSRKVAQEVLRAHAWLVLLQSGTEYAIETARQVARETRKFVEWCARDHAVDDLIRILDARRGLAVHSATTSRTVAERLAALGRDELAGEWRRADGDGTVEVARGAGSLRLPGTLRRRALFALSEEDDSGRNSLLDPPSVPEIAEAVRAQGADALVYLVPGTETHTGMAVTVPATGTAQLHPLPDLVAGPGSRLARYAETYTAWHGADSGTAEFETWREALRDLCHWAWTVAGRDLVRIGRDLTPEPVPRLVLVPVGDLALVPWHAAAHNGISGRRYLLQDLVVSYTPSARMLCEVVTRKPVAGNAILVGDPAASMPAGGFEASAIRDTFHPDGTFLGGTVRPPLRRWQPSPQGKGTPAEVLTGLANPVGLLHLACHAVADAAAPHRSHVELAGGDGLLHTKTLLGLNPAQPIALDRVVLSGCTTNAPGEDYDEAFSLSTTFLAMGARTAVGSLWRVPAGRQTAHLMFVLHHFLHDRGLPPADALRAAQLWALDPGHDLPGQMPPELRTLRGTTDVPDDDPVSWAGFTHLGR